MVSAWLLLPTAMVSVGIGVVLGIRLDGKRLFKVAGCLSDGAVTMPQREALGEVEKMAAYHVWRETETTETRTRYQQDAQRVLLEAGFSPRLALHHMQRAWMRARQ